MKVRYKRVVVKVGSNVLTTDDGMVNVTRISSLVDQIAILGKNGVEVVVVSSGAVASGKSLFTPARSLDIVSSRQLFSALGQAKLINLYYQLFREHGLVCGQVLTTKESFATRRHYLNQQHCIQVMLDNGVIPIVNENDTIAVSELMFTDNDELSGLLATMMGADALIILSNVDGIYDGNPSDNRSRVIRQVESQDGDLSGYIQTTKSTFGRGGMLTKSRMAYKVSMTGVEVVIANGLRTDILLDVVDQEQDVVSTRFLPADHTMSKVKRWIAYSEGCAKGAIHLTEGGSQAICSEVVTSLLPIGIEKVIGDFHKHDIVKLYDNNGSEIGLGKVAIDSELLESEIGKKGGKVVVHYDYLYLY